VLKAHRSMLLEAAVSVSISSVSRAADRNSTELPTYPHDDGGLMHATYRSLSTGQHCMHYQSKTPDAVADVEAWHREQMPKGKTDDVNKGSLYGSHFKLDGIKLLLGNDIVSMFRMENQKTTSIEIFKCKNAPHG